jgi:hypothetical protein
MSVSGDIPITCYRDADCPKSKKCDIQNNVCVVSPVKMWSEFQNAFYQNNSWQSFFEKCVQIFIGDSERVAITSMAVLLIAVIVYLYY